MVQLGRRVEAGLARQALWRAGTSGMTVTEALAHGLPVIAVAVGGLPEALGSTADGTRPGQLIPSGDPAALTAAIGDWLGDERHRHRHGPPHYSGDRPCAAGIRPHKR